MSEKELQVTECPFCGSPPSEIRNADFEYSFECGTGFQDEAGAYRSQDCYERQIEELESALKSAFASMRIISGRESQELQQG